MHPPPNVHSYLIRGNREYLNRQKVSTERVRSDERLCKGMNLFHVYIYIYYRERERRTLPCTTWLWKMVTWPRRREFETYARSCVGIHSFLSSGEMACWLLVNGSCWGKSFAFKLPTKKGSHDRYARFLNDLWIAFVLIAFRNWNWFSVSDFVDFFLKFYFSLFFLNTVFLNVRYIYKE